MGFHEVSIRVDDPVYGYIPISTSNLSPNQTRRLASYQWEPCNIARVHADRWVVVRGELPGGPFAHYQDNILRVVETVDEPFPLKGLAGIGDPPWRAQDDWLSNQSHTIDDPVMRPHRAHNKTSRKEYQERNESMAEHGGKVHFCQVVLYERPALNLNPKLHGRRGERFVKTEL